MSDASLAGFDFRHMDLIQVDFRNADLSGANLSEVNLLGADLCSANMNNAKITGADLSKTDLHSAELKAAVGNHALIHSGNLSQANLTEADLRSCHMSEVNLRRATLQKANLRNVCLSEADLREVDLENADLTGADLSYANLVHANLKNANLTGCRVYASCIWDTKLQGATQVDLVITRLYEPNITVDYLEVAQFVYLLLNNQRIGEIIDNVGKKTVLILGRFTPERKVVLDAIRKELRRLGFVPMMFDFDRPTERDFTETVMTLAGISCFIVADITNPSSSPLELHAIVPNYMIPLVPIVQEGEQPFSMFRDLRGKYDWVLDPLTYKSVSELVGALEKAVVRPALEKHRGLVRRKRQEFGTRHVEDNA